MVEETDQFEALIRGQVAQIGTVPEVLESVMDKAPAMGAMTIRLPEETLEDLDFLSSFMQVSKGGLIRMLITERLRSGRMAIESACAARTGQADE